LIASDGQTLVWGEPFGDHLPIHRLAQMLDPFADPDHRSHNAIGHFGGNLSGQ
jgi:hypothetical protein